MKFKNDRLIVITLFAIIVLAAGLRFYKLGQVPPSISWDEAAVGYNAWTITQSGRDEWGNFLPLTFKSFEDDKHPVHIYLTAISVGILGPSDFSVRMPAALFGIFNVILLFLLGKELFNKWTGLLAALFLAVSPYNIHFSHFNHELNFTIFFFLLGLWLFFKGIQGRKNFLPLSFLSFGITLISYHSAKIVVPAIVLLLVALYFQNLIKIKRQFLISLAILGFFAMLFFLNPALLGFARARQTSFSEDDIKKTEIYNGTRNEALGRLEIVGRQYMSHFNPQYLFISGDKNPRLSSQSNGEFYKIDALLLITGCLALLWKKNKVSALLLSWVLLAPIPASLVNEAPHASRAMFMTGSWHLISAFGFFTLFSLIKRLKIHWVFLAITLGVIAYELQGYLRYYYGEYGIRYAIEWQYGMEQVVDYLKDHDGYFQAYMTDARSQPYVFFLFYLRQPLDTFLSSVWYNETQSRSYNLIYAFDKYHFGIGKVAEIKPNPGVLYVLTPSEYDGIRKDVFSVKKIIRYPNGTDAFFLVSYP